MGTSMAKFGKASLSKLEFVHPDLIRLFSEVVKDFDCKIIEGWRSVARQRQLFTAGKTRIDGVKKLGKHNYMPSLAVDVTPYPIDWNNYKRHREFAAFVMEKAKELGVRVRWGGDWDGDGDTTDQTFNDLVHFELIEGTHE